MSILKVSVIMPVERLGGDAERAIAAVLDQRAPFAFELITVSAAPLEPPAGARVRNVVVANRNPATRRNRAVSVAEGEILAFIDDDAFAADDWLARGIEYLDGNPEVLAVGGPDPAPADSSIAELISDTLLSTPGIGSGVAAHEARRGTFQVASPSDIALVNLFIRQNAFEPFDEEVGYIGEDTELLERLCQRGPVMYHDAIRVHHRRRAFPRAYLAQRWRYRVKTGEMLVRGSRAHRSNPKIVAFLVAGALGILLFPFVLLPYVCATFVLGARATRLPLRWWPVIPFAFAAHHVTYWLGIVTGMFREFRRKM